MPAAFAGSLHARLVILFCLGLLPACTSIERLALPKSGLADSHWTETGTGSISTVDHSSWDSFLANYVATDANGVNRVAYGGGDRCR